MPTKRNTLKIFTKDFRFSNTFKIFTKDFPYLKPKVSPSCFRSNDEIQPSFQMFNEKPVSCF